MTTNVMANYSYGEDCFKEIPSVLATYRIQSIAFVGGKRALDSSEAEVRSILEEANIKVTGSFVYGTCLLYTSPSPRD